jgi:penicillin-binding protein 2
MNPSDKNKLKTYTRRATMVSGGMLLLSSALVGRMYYLQVVSRSRYELLAEQNRISMRLLAPTRGEILDRFDRPLALSTTDYQINVIPEETEELTDTLNALTQYIPISDDDYKRIVKAVAKQRSFLPVSVARNLDWKTFSSLNVNMPDLPGIQPDVGTTRYYPEKEDVAHLVGYVGPVSENELTDDPLLELPEFKIGKNGIEKTLDLKLRGSAGNSQVEVNFLGRVIRELSRRDSLPGEQTNLTIDLDIQKFCAQRVRDESAAIVVMDIFNGEILAMASTPGFDPNDFNVGISQKKWNSLMADKRNPLTNKAVSGQYSPGSTFKMIVALAGLEAGIISENDKVFCNGQYRIGKRIAHCWRKGGHGRLSVVEAISQSCDVFFYDLSLKVGIEKIHDMAARLGIGKKFDIGIMSERAGINPNSAWKFGAHGEKWQGGDTANVGIGQGYVSTTPLQLAVMTSRLVNGGLNIFPKIIKEDENQYPLPTSLGLSKENLNIVLQGMSDVYNHPRGTAFPYRSRKKEYKLGGKTGTTQVRRISTAERQGGVIKNEDKLWEERDHALFVGYGPVESPRYAVSVLVEHGGGGSTVSSPIARDILEYVLENDPSKKLLDNTVVAENSK